MTNSANKWIKKARQKLIEQFGGCCKNCGERAKLEFAHKHEKETPIINKKRGRGRKERYYDIKKNPECYYLLCNPCHRDYDAGRLILFS